MNFDRIRIKTEARACLSGANPHPMLVMLIYLLLTSGVKILAKLEEVTDEGITLSYEEKQAVEGKKKKQLVKVTRSYPFDQIKYTKEWLDFK